MDKILVLGGSGLVGKALINELENDYDVYGTYHSEYNNKNANNLFKLDIDNLNDIKEIIKTVKPNIIISCLSGDFNEQFKIHKEIENYLSRINGKLYFCSSANVFDNEVDKVHYEYDCVSAESDYGKFKIKCEKELALILKDKLCIIRLPCIWGKNSPRFNNLVEMLKKHEEIPVYSNYYLTNNTDVMLAKQIHYIIRNNFKGVYHLSTNDVVNYQEFIEEIIEKLEYKDIKFKITKLPSEKYYLAISTIHTDIPSNFKITNKDVVNYLTMVFFA
ncbi:sugar nucleotide-binding protein [Clostridium akagii]|uniref:sugar nucleotide-binding protein n=1 Tax=Clostridium akagii TaxID=91623 RepID=UPI00047E9C7A|nr:sugar nucleotide-binding protein [Clostridium akagii]